MPKKKQALPKSRRSDANASQNSYLKPNSIVGVGASAGGLEAFEHLLAAVSPGTGMAFVLVQHLAPKHESMLSELLAKATRMPVIEVKEGARVEANHVYVIPPNKDMSIADGVLHLSALPPDRSRRMPIDMFFRSLAEDQQNRAIGVILSGTASDGTLGLQAIKAAGGVTFAQDEESAKYNAMPRNAIAAGNVDFVLPPDLIAREFERIARHVNILLREPPESGEQPPIEDAVSKILLLLRNHSRVDFSFYKPGTINRRITRRMFLRKIESLQDYLHFLRKNPDEVEALFNDVLINVTSFFRDHDAFAFLQKKVFPGIFKNKPPQSTIRIWVPGCSTGEEAYSLAIALLEVLGDNAEQFQIQIFATDVSDNIIQKARAGMYPESIAMDISSDRLRRFFQRLDGGYQISKPIRDLCLFAKQDIAKDPPFSKLDMISCRNVMIYMTAVLQKRVFPLLHYALNPGGFLFLGTSETVGAAAELFVALDRKHKVFQRKTTSVPVHLDFAPYRETKEEPHPQAEAPGRPDLQRIAQQVLLNRYAPASVMVDDQLNIVQFLGQTGRFLDPTPGDATLNLLRMVKAGLQVELRLAFPQAKRNGSIRKDGVIIEQDGHLQTVNFEIIPVQNVPDKERYFLVVFDEAASTPLKSLKAAIKESPRQPAKKSVKGTLSHSEVENRHLKEELEATRGYLQSIIGEQRATNEELRSANEEIQSSNEELQSINEELETAKEELQSTNEELTTVNEELQNRNEELSKVNNDLNNLLSSVNIPIIMLGNDLRIRRFTPMAEGLMNLIAADVGRPITDIKPNLKLPDMRDLITHVIDTLEIRDVSVEDNKGHRYSMRIRPYRTIDHKIDGVVIVLLDFDQRVHLQQASKES